MVCETEGTISDYVKFVGNFCDYSEVGSWESCLVEIFLYKHNRKNVAFSTKKTWVLLIRWNLEIYFLLMK